MKKFEVTKRFPVLQNHEVVPVFRKAGGPEEEFVKATPDELDEQKRERARARASTAKKGHWCPTQGRMSAFATAGGTLAHAFRHLKQSSNSAGESMRQAVATERWRLRWSGTLSSVSVSIFRKCGLMRS